MGFDIIPRKIGPRMFVALALASSIPILAFLYLLSSVSSPVVQAVLVIAIVLWLTALGYYLAHSVVRSIKDLMVHAQALVAGEVNKKMPPAREEEVAKLADSFNKLANMASNATQDVRSYLDRINDKEKELEKIKSEREEELAKLADSFNRLAEIASDATQGARAYMGRMEEKDKGLEAKLSLIEEELFSIRAPGFYDERHIKSRLDEEVKNAVGLQRPCSFIVFGIDDYDKLLSKVGDTAVVQRLSQVTSAITAFSSKNDTLGKLRLDTFCLILQNRSKQNAYQIAESIRQKIQAGGQMTISCGISENPIDGVTGEEIYRKAMLNLELAKVQGKNRTVV